MIASVNATEVLYQEETANATQTEIIVYVIILIVESIVSVLGSGLVCVTFLTVRTLSSKPSSKLIVNLAVSDAAMGALVLPMTTVTVVNQAWISGDVWCQMQGFIKTYLSQVQRSTLLLIAADRLFRVKFYYNYGRRSQAMVLPVVVVWAVNLPLATTPLFGWGEFKWAPHLPSCSVDWLASLSYSITFLTVYGVFLQVLMASCYLLIFMELRASRLRVQAASIRLPAHPSATTPPSTSSPTGTAHARNPPCPRPCPLMSRDEVALARTMITLVILSSLLSLPYIVVNLISLANNVPVPYQREMAVTLLVYLNSCLNPIIYGVTNSRFRQGFKSVIRCSCRQQR